MAKKDRNGERKKRGQKESRLVGLTHVLKFGCLHITGICQISRILGPVVISLENYMNVKLR